ncbi:MAG: hypothetical protein CL609_07480 [Anaerolineaceae bacterium]|nr:hypothetical protein [Anaerolineaceae bacterium]
MDSSNVFLDSMSISTINTPKMVNFYETVFKTRLHPQQMGKYYFFTGPIGNINLTLAPNELKGARAGHNRYHLSFVVPNLEEHLMLAKKSGGTQTQEIDLENNERYCEIVDPDGNPIELIEFVSSYP